jgi:IS66 C-terminal element
MGHELVPINLAIWAERRMRAVAVGRKAFLFVSSERAGHTAAIYYSLVESCKANNINTLTYLTYVLSNARNRVVQLQASH